MWRRRKATYTVLDTHTVSDPHETALYFGAVLAGDKGVGSTMVKVRKGWDVVFNVNRAVRFIAK